MDTHIEESPKEQKQPTGPEMQQPPHFCCPCGGFLGWKQIRLGGRSMSRSYSDLRSLGGMQSRGWAWESTPTPTPPPKMDLKKEEPKATPVPGLSPLEKMPPEVLGKEL